ncbi:MAG: hypothetical protein JW958_00570 [Candidatus Eisenbacteria bacterium]|nr:hypothetical protein [Candidatus Eisenbacteria bacterium]
MAWRESGSGRSFPIPFFAVVLLVVLATILLVDDIRLRREAELRDAKARVEETAAPEAEEETAADDASPSPLSDTDIRLLRKQGLEDPERDLIADLRSRTDLIPFDGVHGGTMFFSNIVILPGGSAFALFEDGHIAGRMLLGYEVEAGRIDWTMLHATLD